MLNAGHLFPRCSLQMLSSFSPSNPCEASIIGAMNSLLLAYQAFLQCHEGSRSPELRGGKSSSHLKYNKLGGELVPQTFLPHSTGLPVLSSGGWCSPCWGRIFSTVFQVSSLFFFSYMGKSEVSHLHTRRQVDNWTSGCQGQRRKGSFDGSGRPEGVCSAKCLALTPRSPPISPATPGTSLRDDAQPHGSLPGAVAAPRLSGPPQCPLGP